MAGTSRAAQPALNTVERLYPDGTCSSAHDHDFSRIYSFHSYNVGWNYSDKTRSEHWLGGEIVRLYREHGFDAIGISEIFEVEYDASKLKEVDERRGKILDSLLEALRAASSSAGQPANSSNSWHESSEWSGRKDAHCFYI